MKIPQLFSNLTETVTASDSMELRLVQLFLRWAWFAAEDDHSTVIGLIDATQTWCSIVLGTLGLTKALKSVEEVYKGASRALTVKRDRHQYPRTILDLPWVGMEEFRMIGDSSSFKDLFSHPDLPMLKKSGTCALTVLLGMLEYHAADGGPGAGDDDVSLLLRDAIFLCRSVNDLVEDYNPVNERKRKFVEYLEDFMKTARSTKSASAKD